MAGVFVGSLLTGSGELKLVAKAEGVLRGAARSGPALARELGAAGEEAAGIAKNTARIPSLTGTANYRIPYVLSREAGLIGDVKNVG